MEHYDASIDQLHMRRRVHLNMKKMTQQDLDRLGKSRGVKVRRKMGAQPKKPELDVEVEDAVAMSGVETPEIEAPAPALPLEVNMEPFAAMSASMATSDKNFQALIVNNTKALDDFRTQLAEKKGLNKWQEADFIRHKVKRKDKLIDYVDSTPMRNKA